MQGRAPRRQAQPCRLEFERAAEAPAPAAGARAVPRRGRPAATTISAVRRQLLAASAAESVAGGRGEAPRGGDVAADQRAPGPLEFDLGQVLWQPVARAKISAASASALVGLADQPGLGEHPSAVEQSDAAESSADPAAPPRHRGQGTRQVAGEEPQVAEIVQRH